MTSGNAALILAIARCASPAGLNDSSPDPDLTLSGVFGKITTRCTPARTALSTKGSRPLSKEMRLTPGMEGMGSSAGASCTKMGWIRFAAVREVSATVSLIACIFRLRRGLCRILRGSTVGVPGGERAAAATPSPTPTAMATSNELAPPPTSAEPPRRAGGPAWSGKPTPTAASVAVAAHRTTTATRKVTAQGERARMATRNQKA
mmetsp:Transcript_50039/g.113725  ORF Transcript_50039/g.113725 Transcript_50039/m.113725 type:complete len:205 (-) Transcript_50039:8-622(-)